MEKTNYQKLKTSIYWSVFYIGLLGSILHFLYDLSGKSVIIGIIAPINESIWEHLKLVFLPTIIWWLVAYKILGKKENIKLTKWFIALVTSIVISMIFIINFYYFYTGAFGIQSTFLDISSFFIAILLGQLIAFYLYKNPNYRKYQLYISIFIFIVLIILFITFTFKPPDLPLFLESSNN